MCDPRTGAAVYRPERLQHAADYNPLLLRPGPVPLSAVDPDDHWCGVSRPVLVCNPVSATAQSLWGKHLLMRSCEPAGHDADHGDLDHRPAALQRVLVVPVQPPPPGQPPERPLHHPPPRLYLEP